MPIWTRNWNWTNRNKPEMALPTPHPGLVISYAYLWSDEARRGRGGGVLPPGFFRRMREHLMPLAGQRRVRHVRRG